MTSLLCVKSLKGSVQIHDAEGAECLQAAGTDADDKTRTTFMPRGRGKKEGQHPVSTPATLERGSVQSVAMATSCVRSSNWISSTYAQDLQDKTKKESDATRSLYSPLLQTEQTFVKDVNEYLDQVDMLDLRKRELLHKTWNSRVYEPIRRKILQAMNGPEFSEKDRRRRELHRQYLEYVNQKGHVFLDTMDKGEYYAQALNGHRPAPITVHTQNLQDPLLSQGRERNKEEQTILRCTTGEVYSLSDIDQIKLPPLPLVPLGRHNANSVTWLEMPLGNIESTTRKASRLRMKGNCTDSQIDFNQWSKMAFDPSVVGHEMQLQKKRMFVNTPPFDRPPRPVLKPPFACSTEKSVKFMCPVSS